MHTDPEGFLGEFVVDALRVRVYRDRPALGRAAAEYVAQAIAALIATAGRAHVIFAAAPSQDQMLEALREPGRVDWPRVVAFHMDEYFGLPASHPAAFRAYLKHHIFDPAKLPDSQLRLIPGERMDNPLKTCLDYSERLRAEPADIVCAGIGENGHLAFNDPPVADFLDPVDVKVVRLDADCRAQQVHDGCFARIEDVPSHAYTLTIPALLRPSTVSVVVPGPRKAEAVRAALQGPIDERCPASALRRCANAVLWLDRDSASLIA